jgi:hypothetical protein
MINYGMRSGGGIGDVLPKVTSQDKAIFITIFFYNIAFHIIIILILGNMFFGVVLDAFNSLREKTELLEYDSNNVCFICQEDRDSFLTNKDNLGISFEKHIKIDHHTWNYVYFIVYLFSKDANDLNYAESYALDCINKKDLSWLPVKKRSIDDELEEIGKKVNEVSESFKGIRKEKDCEKEITNLKNEMLSQFDNLKKEMNVTQKANADMNERFIKLDEKLELLFTKFNIS